MSVSFPVAGVKYDLAALASAMRMMDLLSRNMRAQSFPGAVGGDLRNPSTRLFKDLGTALLRDGEFFGLQAVLLRALGCESTP